jgi:hypothetical protein
MASTLNTLDSSQSLFACFLWMRHCMSNNRSTENSEEIPGEIEEVWPPRISERDGCFGWRVNNRRGAARKRSGKWNKAD